MQNDPLSSFLQLVNTRCVMSGALVAGGAWAIAIPPPDTIKFWGVARGSCWLAFEGEAAPFHLQEGDVFLSSASRALVMASDLSAPRVELAEVLKHRSGTTAHYGIGDDCQLIIASVEWSADYPRLLLDAIPPFIHVQNGSRHARTLAWLMQQLIEEARDDSPGAGAASVQLAHLMFIHTLRAHFDTAEPMAAGWLRVATDKRVNPALRLIHGDPGRPWRLEELAKAAAMSRATFALYFKTVAGVAPMTYLTHWRMRLAERALRENKAQVGDIGRELGYTSEGAFSNAFKRVTGKSPMHFRSAALSRTALVNTVETE
ncbi:AraC family transcriptional regulator [Pseudomonas sp. B22129]|uniref:AraC family transcriptional regulator n=1 Tax=Pseudomonas sp. B22129 TaxID=3235111 RepID=UPI003783DDC2